MKKEIMVKVCSKCGIVNTERAEECESCGEELGVPVKNSEAKKLIKQIAKRNEQSKKAIAAEKFGGPKEEIVDIPVTPARKVIGVIGCLLAVCEIVLMVLLACFSPRFANEMFMVGFCVLLLLTIAILYCFIPGTMWTISNSLYHLYYKEMPTPSDIGLVMQVVSCVLLILVSVGFMVAQFMVSFGSI